jgi:hypothetical protein
MDGRRSPWRGALTAEPPYPRTQERRAHPRYVATCGRPLAIGCRVVKLAHRSCHASPCRVGSPPRIGSDDSAISKHNLVYTSMIRYEHARG